MNFPDGHRLVIIFSNKVVLNLLFIYCIQIMDNDPKHCSNLTKDWFVKENINHWITPPQSPDLNEVENVFHELKTYIRINKTKTKIDLIKIIGRFWKEKMTVEKCKAYIDHIKRVLPLVILNNGGATAY